MKPHLVVVGSLNADFVVNVPRFPAPGETLIGRDFKVFPGGKGGNQAYGAARLGLRTSLIGQVGEDAHGAWLRENLAGAGVDVSRVRPVSGISTGIAAITIDSRGQNQIIIVPGANGAFTPECLNGTEALLAQAGVVLLQLEIPLATVERVAQQAKAAGALVILDPAPAQVLPDTLLGCVDYLTPNETELAILTEDQGQRFSRDQAATLAGRLLKRGARKVIVKMGAQGALFLSAEQEHFWPAFPVTAVDTTAAGDAFNAGFAVALAQGSDEQSAGRFACAAAACSVTKPGAQSSMPTAAEVELLLTQGRERQANASTITSTDRFT